LFLALTLFIATTLVSHYSYKKAQKHDFKEKWDSFTSRITGNASLALSDEGVIGDEFASFLYWIPAVTDDISSIVLFDSEGKSIYSAGENTFPITVIETYVKSSLSGAKLILTPDESNSEYTIISYPVISGGSIAAVLLMTVDEGPVFTNPKSAFSKFVIGFLSILSFILIIIGVVAYRNLISSRIQKEIMSAKTDAFKLISHQDDFSENLNTVFSRFSNLIDAELSTLFIFDHQNDDLTQISEYSLSKNRKNEDEDADVYLDELRHRAIDENKIIFISYNESGRIELHDNVPITTNPSGVIIPLHSNSEVNGVWEILFSTGKLLNKKFAECKNIADYLSVVINNAIGKIQLSEDSAISEYVLKMIDLFGAPKNLSDSLDTISKKIVELEDLLFCRTYQIEEDSKHIRLISEAISDSNLICHQQKKVLALDDLPGHKIAVLSGQIQCFGPEEIERLNICIDSSGQPAKINCDIIIAPLTYGSQTLGCFVIGIDSVSGRRNFHTKLFGQLSRFLSPAFESAISYARLDNFHANSNDKSKKKSFEDKIMAARKLANVVVGTLNENLIMLTEEINALNESSHSSRKILGLIKEITKIERFVTNLNDFANTEQTRNFEQLELAQLIRYVEKRIINDPVLCDSIGNNIHIITRNASSGQIFADPQVIYKIMSILLLNSIEASPEGGEIIIESDIKGKMGVISVKDNGCGMGTEVRKNIFEPFFSTKKGPGRGLGLTIAYNIISSIGGTIEVESKIKKGTSVMVQIPLTDPEQTALYSSKGKGSNRILLTLPEQ
jgi:hypothetical protein